MNDTDWIKALAKTAREHKESAVAEHGPGSDIPPLLLVAGADDEVIIVGIPDQRPQALLIYRNAPWSFGASAVAMVNEIYTIFGEGLQPPEGSFEVGNLQRRFQEGDPEVTEAVGVLVTTRAAPREAEQIIMPYHYAGDQLVWGETQTMKTGAELVVQGDIPSAMAQGFEDPDPPLPLPLAVIQMGRLGARMVISPVNPTMPRRNDPCPCGSGRKFKQCHQAVLN